VFRGERRLRGFEHQVLRKVIVPIRVDVAGGWRALRSEELHEFAPRTWVVKAGSVR
jgi:hypothetical protein